MSLQGAQPANPAPQYQTGSMATPEGMQRGKPWQREELEGEGNPGDTMASRERAQLIQRKTLGFLEPSSPGGSITGRREGGF